VLSESGLVDLALIRPALTQEGFWPRYRYCEVRRLQIPRSSAGFRMVA
jgi:hypothetical protein